MFDLILIMIGMLSTPELNRMIRHTTEQRTAVHYQMVSADDGRALVDPIGPEWARLAAEYDELAKLTDALYAELINRDGDDFPPGYTFALPALPALPDLSGEIYPHDEGTSYCTSIPGKCPMHDV